MKYARILTLSFALCPCISFILRANENSFVHFKSPHEVKLVLDNSQIERIEKGVKAFLNSDEQLDFFPTEFTGRDLLQAEKGALTIECQKSGYVAAVVPVGSKQMQELESYGFKRLDYPEFPALVNQPDSKSAAMQAYLEEGETLDISDWVIVVFGIADRGGIPYEELRNLDPPVLLPDGSEFKTWEPKEFKFSKTYYVNQKHSKASDDNPGTEDLPFKTINQAAQVLMPGERVIVSEGVYREFVQPVRGGTDWDNIISYEAAPGEEVFIKGSRALELDWYKSDVWIKPKVRGWDFNIDVGTWGIENVDKIWAAELPREIFDGYNPFAMANLPRNQIDFFAEPNAPWGDLLDLIETYVSCSGMIFQEGKRLIEVPSYLALFTSGPGHFWAEQNGLTIHLWPYDSLNPNNIEFEFTTQEQIFAPKNHNLGYVRVKCFVIEHAGNYFPVPQRGALSTMIGHHWVIEDNTVRWANSIGIDIGKQHWFGEYPEILGHHIIRNNLITDCGINGIAGNGSNSNLIEQNTFLRNCWQPVEEIAEMASIKTHLNHNCLVRKNLIKDTMYSSGIWFDHDNVNNRITQNIIINTNAWGGGILMECSIYPNLIDRNFVWNVKANQNSGGNGFRTYTAQSQIFVNNFIGNAKGAGIYLSGGVVNCRKRPTHGGYHQIYDNIFYNCSQDIKYNTERTTNIIGGNVIADNYDISFDVETLELEISTEGTTYENVMSMIPKDFLRGFQGNIFPDISVKPFNIPLEAGVLKEPTNK